MTSTYNFVPRVKVESPDIDPAIEAIYAVLMENEPEIASKPWHSDDHLSTREIMEGCIGQLIMKRRPRASKQWVEKLPEVCKQVEKRLYMIASSIDEYANPYTLIERIQQLVRDLIHASGTDLLPLTEPHVEAAESSVVTENYGSVRTEVDDNENSRITRDGDCNESEQFKDELQNQGTAELTVGNVLLSGGMSLSISKQVSSQGCSRVFIVKVLMSVSDFVDGKNLPSIFTFSKDLVMEWLTNAKNACCQPTYLAEESYYGGPPFVEHDPSTHWTEPNQLYTWWKNNVERRSKFKVLQEDSQYNGVEPRRLARSRWCQAVVALSEIIRASSGSTNAPRNPSNPGKNESNNSSAPSRRASLPTLDNGSDKRQAPEPEQNSNNRPLYSSNTSNAIPSQTDLTEGSYLLTKSGSLNKPDVYGRFNTESSEQDSRYLLPQNFTVPRNKPVENTILDYVNRAAAGNPSQFGPDLQNLHVTKPQGSSTYTTLSQLQVFNEVGASNRSAQMQLTFPLKLFDIVSDPISDSIIWSDNGTAFHVRDFDDFVSQVLPRHFKHNNFTSFQRQLNLYGFRRLHACDKGTYYHPMFLRNNRELAEQIRRVMTSTSHVNDSFHAMNTLMQSIQSGQNVRHSFDGGATDSTGNLNDPSESNTHASSPYLLSSYSKLTRTDLAAGSVQPVVPIFQQINSSMSSGKMSDIQQLLGYNILNAQDKQKLSSLISSTLTRQLSEDHGTKSKSNSIMHNAGKNYSSTYRKNGDAVQPAEQFLETLDEDSIQRSSYLNEGGDLYNNGQSKTKRSRKKESNTDEPAKKTNLQTDQEKFSRKRKSNEILVSEKNKDNKRSKTKKVTAVERITAVESTVSRSSRKSKLVNTVIVEGKKDKKTGDDDIQAILDESYIEDDLLDLRNPVDCRIYLDFTTKDMLPVPSTKDVSSDNYDASQDLWPSQYAYGIYHGKLTHGKRDVNINYLKQLKSLALISPAMHDSFSDNGSDNVPISPKSSKVGEDYQAVIPSLVAKPTDNGRPLRSNVSYIDSEILWKPGKITEKDLQAYLMNVTNLKLSQVISVGSILVACIPQCSSSKKYRLCAVTAIQNDENPGSLFDLKGNISSKVNIVVHDGIEKWSIPPSACAPFKQWHELKSLQFIYKNNYRIPSNAELLLIDINEFESAQNLKNWSSQDVKIFCDATRRFGDQIRKIWSMHFKAKKSLSNVLEFFHRLYPHTQAGGTKRLISIFKKAETAASGTIDISSEESDSVDNEIEDSDAEGDGDEIENGNVNDDDLVSVEGSSDQESILISSENSSEVLVSNANTSNGKSSTEREIIGYSTRSNRRQHQNVNELTSRQSRRDNKANVANSVNHILLDTVAIGKTGKPAPKKRN